MEIAKKTHLEPSWIAAGDKGFAGESKPGGFAAASDGFISIDIGSLSHIIAASDSSPRPAACDDDKIVGARVLVPFKKAISKKGSQRDGERTELRPITAGKERAAGLIVQNRSVDSSTLLAIKTPTTTTAASNGCRYLHGRRLSWWLHPRRVLVFFASLSSMGTLILLYLTLSAVGHNDAQ